MKVLTVKQPWATLIAKGYKKYEFRTWKTKQRGEILIHAGKGEDKKAYKRFEHLNLNYPKGIIVAKVNIADCIKVDEKFATKLYKEDKEVYKNMGNEDSLGCYAWKIDDVEEIQDDTIIKGKLSLWNLEYTD